MALAVAHTLADNMYICFPMRRRSVHITGILMLFLFFYFSAGYYFLFLCQQIEIKEIAKEICSSESADIELLVLSQQEYNDLQWEDESEFEYKGLPFDVVSIEKKNNAFHIKCYRDINEFMLFTSLNKHLNNHLLSGIPQSKIKVKPVSKIVALASTFIKKDFALTYLRTTSSQSITIPANPFPVTSPSPPPDNFV